MEKRLIPYSVYLKEDIYLRLKEVAKDRKATSLVRDAITMIIEGDDLFNAGYNKAIRDVMDLISQDALCKDVAFQGVVLYQYLNDLLSDMFMNQSPNKESA